MGILSQLVLDLCVSFLRSNQALLSLFFFSLVISKASCSMRLYFCRAVNVAPELCGALPGEAREASGLGIFSKGHLLP